MAVKDINNTPSARVLNQQFHDSFDDAARARAQGIDWVRNRISIFENKYGMSSDDMVRRVQASEIEETDDICSWLIKVDLLRNVESET